MSRRRAIPVSLKRRAFSEQYHQALEVRQDQSCNDNPQNTPEGTCILDTQDQDTDRDLHQTDSREKQDLRVPGEHVDCLIVVFGNEVAVLAITIADADDLDAHASYRKASRQNHCSVVES